jgi:hypothetical protein
MPYEFTYISRRLVREIVENHAARSAGKPVFTGGQVTAKTPGPVSAEFSTSWEPSELSSGQDYAFAATKIVEQRTGTLFERNEYLRIVQDFYIGTVHVVAGWKTGGHDVSAIFSMQVVDGKRVFIALFGSESNLSLHARENSESERSPSYSEGLYRIFESVAEKSDPSLSDYWLEVDDRVTTHERAEEFCAQMAVNVLYPLESPLPSRPLDVLARPHFVLEDVELEIWRRAGRKKTLFDLVIVGAAIWAGRPAPRNFNHVAVPNPAAALLDERLLDTADSLRRKRSRRYSSGYSGLVVDFNTNGRWPELQLNYPDAVELAADDPSLWRSYVTWFMSTAQRYGRTRVKLLAFRRPPFWSPRRYAPLREYFDLEFEAVRTGIEGLFVQQDGIEFVITADGEVYDTMPEGDWRIDRLPGPVYDSAADNLLSVRARPTPSPNPRLVRESALGRSALVAASHSNS